MPQSHPLFLPKRARCAGLRSQISFLLLFALNLSALALSAQAQVAGSARPQPDAPQAQTQDAVTVRGAPRDILHDQEAIWTSPLRLRPHDLKWLAPFALATGAAIATDHRAMSQVVSHDASFNNANVNTSNALIGGFVAAPVALFGYGHFEQSDHAREAGILSGEALVDGVVVEQGMKLIFWRERPTLDSARGRFFQPSVGVDSSFPSSHSVLAWATAETRSA